MPADATEEARIGTSTWLALAAMALFLLATGVRVSARLQRLALAPGHQVGEVRALLGLLQLVSAPLAIGFSLAHFLAAR